MREDKKGLDKRKKSTYDYGMTAEIKKHNQKIRAMKSRNIKKLKKIGRLI